MTGQPTHTSTEQARLAALQRYDILDTLPEAAFDRITRLAATLLGAPIALVGLVDTERQWFKACYGLDARQTDRRVSFCAHAIHSPEVMVVLDATQDPRFAENPLVLGEPGIRFYAGAPLRTPDGLNLGTLCIIDTESRRDFSREQRDILTGLAALVMDELDLRLSSRRLAEESARNQRLRDELDQFFSLSTDVFCITDLGGRVIKLNPAALTLFGEHAATLPLEALVRLSHKDDRERVKVALGASDAAFAFESRIRDPEGGYRWLSWQGRVDAASQRVYASARDISRQKAAEAALRLQERALRAANNGIVIADARQDDQPIIYCNPAFEHITGYSAAEVLGKNCRFLQGPDTSAASLDTLRAALAEGRPSHLVLKNHRKDGTPFWNDLTIAPILDDQGAPTHFVGVQMDVTDKLEAQAAVTRNEAHFRSLIQNASDIVTLLSGDGSILYQSPAIGTLLGYGEDELVGRSAFALVHPDDLAPVTEQFSHLTQSQVCTLTYRFRDAAGGWRWLESSAANLLLDENVAAIVVNSRDISERKRAEDALQALNDSLEARVRERTFDLETAKTKLEQLNEQLRYDAFHDKLTGLANRALFMDRLQLAADRHARRTTGGYAVFYLDCDRFKVVNDSLGHSAGDALLAEVGRRLSACVRPGDTVARLGGDEFTVLLEDLDTAEAALEAAERIGGELRKPYTLCDRTLHLSASIGVVASENASGKPEDIVRDADLAMYRAKALGKATYQLFTPQMRDRALSLLTLEHDLRRALRAGELHVEYQPIVSVETGRVTGFEALARWQHPELGMVSPAEFIPIAEETGLIVALDRFVLETASAQVAAWQREHGPLTLSVNLSGQGFAQADLVAWLLGALAETGLAAGRVRLEITETILMQNSEQTRALFAELREAGVEIYIDDFGTGYSSLSYLQNFSVHTLKIDRSFVSRMLHSPESAELVKTIVQMAHNLGLYVVAEGVETPEQLRALRALGCELGQGYLFSRPLSAAAAAAYMAGVPHKALSRS